jgi:hypothetical protein
MLRQVFWSSGIDLPENAADVIGEATLDSIELPPGEKALMSLTLPAEFIIVFEPVTHAVQFLDVKGEPTRERQALSIMSSRRRMPPTDTTLEMRPGPLRHLDREPHRAPRAALGLDRGRHAAPPARPPEAVSHREAPAHQPELSRDLRTDTLDVDQRLKITSLTFLFTDLKGSTAALRAGRGSGGVRSRARTFPACCTRSWPPRPAPS